MGNARKGSPAAVGWSTAGDHHGFGRCGRSTGREVHVRGTVHWVIEDADGAKEWTMFNEFGVLMQILR